MKLLSDRKFGFKNSGEYVINLLKWFVLSVFIGSTCALAGVLFHYMTDVAAHIRHSHPFVLYLLPAAGIAIVFLYTICGMDNDKGTNAVIQSVRSGDKISVLVMPLIIISTALTHLCGGSSGREGAALQIGGSMGSFFARGMKMKNYNVSVMIMCGMSAVFSAVFGTPLTAAVFSLEVVSVGIMHYAALFPCLIAALTATVVSQMFGVEKTSFSLVAIPEFDVLTIIKILILALCTAVLGIVFITLMHSATDFFGKYIKNKYFKIIVGSVIVIALVKILNTFDYCGPGMNIVEKALETGQAEHGAFLLKMIITVITLSVGFKGGEIVPTFFIGSTFGVFLAPFLNLEPSFAAAVGLIGLFCSVVNCPIASIILSVELFGANGLLYFGVASAVGYFFSGNYSLYSGQKIVFSKLKAVVEDKVTD